MNRGRRCLLVALGAALAGQATAQASPPPRWLTITVRQDRPRPAATHEKTVPNSAVTVDSRGMDPDPKDNARIVGTRASESTARVLDGERVAIQMQTAVPMTFRHFVAGKDGVDEIRGSVTYDAMVQFAVRPRVAGKTVTLEVEPQDPTLIAQRQERERMSLTLKGRLGEWIAVGGADLRAEPEATSTNTGTLRAQTRPVGNQRGVWLKVELEPGMRR